MRVLAIKKLNASTLRVDEGIVGVASEHAKKNGGAFKFAGMLNMKLKMKPKPASNIVRVLAIRKLNASMKAAAMNTRASWEWPSST